MSLISEKYNPNEFYDSVDFIKETTTNEEKMAWLKHPCTMALARTLEGDLCAIVSIWLGGGFAEDSSTEATALKQAEARGKARTIDDVLEYIKEISTPLEENIDDRGSNS